MGGIVGGISDAVGATNNYQATAPNIQTQDLIGQIGQANNQYNQNYANQNALAQMLLAQANGEATSPASLALQQATNQNIAQNAGIVAGTKGINPALAARLAAQNAATTGQQAVLQSGQLQLQSQNNLGNLYNQMGNQSLQNQSTLQNAQAQQNNAINTGSLGAQQINAGVAQGNAATNAKIAGGIMSGAGSALGLGLAHGGVVPGVPLVHGDHPVNDQVPAMLTPKEIVLPTSVTEAKDAPQKAKEFVEHIKKQKKEPPSYGQVISMHKALQNRVVQLEAKVGGKS